MFSWSKAENKPEISEHQKLRQQFIADLEYAFPVCDRSLDKSWFDIPISQNYQGIIVRIDLPPSFPERPPTLTLVGPSSSILLSHPSVSAQTRLISHPRLLPQNWSVHCSLSSIVREVTNELAAAANKVPPASAVSSLSVPSSSPSVSHAPSASFSSSFTPSSSASSSPRSIPVSPRQPSKSVSSSSPPPAAAVTSFPILDSCGADELQALLTNSKALDAILIDLPAFLTNQELLQSTEEELLKAAKAVSARKNEVTAARSGFETAYAALLAKRAELEPLLARQQAVLQHTAPPIVYRQLCEAIAQVHAQSEALKEKFLSDENTVSASFPSPPPAAAAIVVVPPAPLPSASSALPVPSVLSPPSAAAEGSIAFLPGSEAPPPSSLPGVPSVPSLPSVPSASSSESNPITISPKREAAGSVSSSNQPLSESDFISQFLKLRTLYHLRCAKRERLLAAIPGLGALS